MAFRGWPAEAVEFYEGLCADNSKTYWTAHKHVYDEAVRAPMVELLAELKPEFGPARIYRPNRDVRFSKDKSPYKTQIAAVLERGGYIKLSAEGLGIGAGAYMMDSPSLQRFRAAVADDATGAKLVGIIAKLEKSGIGVSTHESLKRVPAGYPPDHPRADLLRYKDLVAWRDWPVAAWLGTAAAKKRVVDTLRATDPLRAWLDAALSP
ncbi:MAG: hypothetical protein QOD07_2556 [Frankiaceae bacterium]|jgi:uncharacterized protein (TIGR02453 family)|nr:hypothetical protein [Frankiaceae bacterium]